VTPTFVHRKQIDPDDAVDVEKKKKKKKHSGDPSEHSSKKARQD
jgi:hypothetical protein